MQTWEEPELLKSRRRTKANVPVRRPQVREPFLQAAGSLFGLVKPLTDWVRPGTLVRALHFTPLPI